MRDDVVERPASHMRRPGDVLVEVLSWRCFMLSYAKISQNDVTECHAKILITILIMIVTLVGSTVSIAAV